MAPFSSPILRVDSIALDIVNAINSSRRLSASKASESAERNPATGALIRSFFVTKRLIRQSTSLYAVLKHIRKRPSLVQSRCILAFWLLIKKKKTKASAKSSQILSLTGSSATLLAWRGARYFSRRTEERSPDKTWRVPCESRFRNNRVRADRQMSCPAVQLEASAWPCEESTISHFSRF